MEKYRRESHIRSLLKGISWRIIATADTVAVVLLVTCLFSECSLENAITIGLIEFVIKFGMYYLHERAWQVSRRDGEVSKIETIYKSLSWRLLATSMTFLISGAVLESFDKIALLIALTELFTKFVLYYFHERIWLQLPLGRIREAVLGKSKNG